MMNMFLLQTYIPWMLPQLSEEEPKRHAMVFNRHIYNQIIKVLLGGTKGLSQAEKH